ncbi:MAG: tRNA 2-thiouridine(34) synthase MnmA [Candidatus Pacearchaeota archaeon]|nr:tRNA 2-thiouridine(34) synthase MnmA [Candidatus Pacearchaeota archaeon]
MKQKTVLLALSGGVDSSVAALLLKKQGYKVIAAFMKNFSQSKNPLTGECSYIQEKKMAQKIASILNIKFVVLDFEKQYQSQIIKQMFEAYKKGLTPNPDVECNKKIKFPLLWKIAKKKFNADFIATGHYAGIKKTPSGYYLLAGKDKTKDQSYFLYKLTQNDLSHTLFPNANLTKKEVREIARRHNFPNWNKHGTTGICFVGKINIKSFLEKKIKNKTGNIISPEGEIIGTHPGIFYYTIGQKIGSHIGMTINKPKKFAQEKYYVAKKIPKTNTIIAAPKNHPILKKSQIIIKNFHLINPKEKIPKKLKARIRHLGKLHPGKLIRKNKKFVFISDKPIEYVAEGQSIVIYNKNVVVGGGEISNSF